MLNAKKNAAMKIPKIAREAKMAYTVLFTLVCSMMRTVLSFGGYLKTRILITQLNLNDFNEFN